MLYQVAIHEVPAQTVVCIRSRTTIGGLARVMSGSFAHLYGAAGPLHAKVIGDPFVIYHTVDAGMVDAEMCVPVDRTDEPPEPIRARIVPGALVARTSHFGRYDSVAAAYDALTAWIAADAYQPVGAFRERFLDGPADDSGEACVTEVEVAVEPALELATACSWFG